jgi:LmbE family N-acetylglucosaminyl deacetylase
MEPSPETAVPNDEPGQVAPPSWRPVLVLAAHPDDETIGAGGLLARLRSPIVVHVTNGVPRDRRFWPAGVGGPGWEYARLRRSELVRALHEAGLVEPLLLCLGAFDQEAVLSLAALVLRLEEILAEQRPAMMVTHPYEGGHPDHDAAAFIASAAVQRLRRAGLPVPLLVEMTSYHPRRGSMQTATFLETCAREVVQVLPEATRFRKQRMFAAYRSQEAVLSAFRADVERFRRAPAYDFTRSPSPEPLLYERWEFPLTGRRWRELAKAAIQELGLEAP